MDVQRHREPISVPMCQPNVIDLDQCASSNVNDTLAKDVGAKRNFTAIQRRWFESPLFGFEFNDIPTDVDHIFREDIGFLRARLHNEQSKPSVIVGTELHDQVIHTAAKLSSDFRNTVLQQGGERNLQLVSCGV